MKPLYTILIVLSWLLFAVVCSGQIPQEYFGTISVKCAVAHPPGYVCNYEEQFFPHLKRKKDTAYRDQHSPPPGSVLHRLMEWSKQATDNFYNIAAWDSSRGYQESRLRLKDLILAEKLTNEVRDKPSKWKPHPLDEWVYVGIDTATIAEGEPLLDYIDTPIGAPGMVGHQGKGKSTVVYAVYIRGRRGSWQMYTDEGALIIENGLQVKKEIISALISGAEYRENNPQPWKSNK